MRLDLAGDDSGNFIFMKLIPLSKTGKHKGKYFAQVDDEDYEYLNQFNWHVAICKTVMYAVRKTERGKTIFYMHRIIMNVSNSNIEIDHIDHNGLNNQKRNIRNATVNQNGWNKKSSIHSSSKYIGVSINNRDKNWQAGIKKNGKSFFIGAFKSEYEAAKARDKKAKELFGEFANLNFN